MWGEGGVDGGGKLQGPIDHLIWYLENQEVAWNFFSRQEWEPWSWITQSCMHPSHTHTDRYQVKLTWGNVIMQVWTRQIVLSVPPPPKTNYNIFGLKSPGGKYFWSLWLPVEIYSESNTLQWSARTLPPCCGPRWSPMGYKRANLAPGRGYCQDEIWPQNGFRKLSFGTRDQYGTDQIVLSASLICNVFKC